MKRLFFALALALLIPVFAGAQQKQFPTLKPFKELPEETPTPLARKDKWGFADAKGKFVIKPVFDAVEPFRTVTAQNVGIDVAKVRVGDKWGFITTENVYLFEPGYDSVTDFDEGGVAVGTVGETKSLLGTVPAMSAKGKFWTLSGVVRLTGLSEVGAFMPSGIAWAAEGGKWGMLSHSGFWKLPAEYEEWSACREDLFYVKKDGKTGLVASDGKAVLAPEFDELYWNGGRNRFVAVQDGKYGEYEADGAMRYPCIFDSIPLESVAGYVEMWDGNVPSLFLPGDRMYTVAEYDGPLPDWFKPDKAADPVLVSIASDLPEFKEFGPVEEDSTDPDSTDPAPADTLIFPTVVLSCGDTLAQVLSALMDGGLEGLADSPLHYHDAGEYLYYWQHMAKEFYTLGIVDLSDRSKTEISLAGKSVLREKEGIIAGGDGSFAGLAQSMIPEWFLVAGAHRVPVLRYELHRWGGKAVVFLGHNVPDATDRYLEQGWRRMVSPNMLFELGDFTKDAEASVRELFSVQVQTPDPATGLAVYQVLRQTADYSEDAQHPVFGKREPVACGLMGMDSPFFMQALFEDIRWYGSDLEIKTSGGWQTISLYDLKGLDPFVQPVLEDEAVPFVLVEVKPSFQGGDANTFSEWVNNQLVYPEIAKENGVQGRVMLQFTVGVDGRVSEVRVLRGVDPSLDKEAVRVVSQSPQWTPGRQRDRAVRVTYTFPVIFQLR